MHEQNLDTLTRRAAGVLSRRRSLVTLGSAAAASALAGSAPVQAGRTARRARKRAKKKCRRQIDQCHEAIVARCEGEESCINNHEHCCPLLADCKASEALDCWFGSLG